MADYLKNFETTAEYNTYINGDDVLKPNVSYCDDNNEVHYNPIETRIVATFNVTNTSQPTTICYSSAMSQFSQIEIDGILQPSVVSSYQFDTTGEHTIKYTLADPTTIANFTFMGCNTLTHLIIPNTITIIGTRALWSCSNLISVTMSDSTINIGERAFNNCSKLESIIIPSNVTNIGYAAFEFCSGLNSITSLVTTPPTLSGSAFDYTNDCPIYVPAESVNVYKAANGWSTYASRIQAIPTT